MAAPAGGIRNPVPGGAITVRPRRGARLQWLGQRRMKGSANAAWITWGASLRSVERRHGDRAQNRRGGAPEGAPALARVGGRLLKRCPSYDLRRSGAPPPSGEAQGPRQGEEKAGRKPGQRISRPDGPRGFATR